MTASPVPDRILKIETQWRAWLEAFVATLTLVQDALPTKLRGLFRSTPEEAARHAQSLFDHVVIVAAECLSITGALTVSAEPYFKRFAYEGYSPPSHIAGDPIAWARAFSPVDIYRAIAADYPAEKVRAIESAFLANTVLRRFDLGGNTPMVERAGRIVLSLSADATNRSDGTFGYSCFWAERLHDEVRSLMRILVGLLGDGELDELRLPLSSALLCDGHVSRERITLTEHVGLILYKNKVEVLLTPQAGAALNRFLSEWADPARAQAA